VFPVEVLLPPLTVIIVNDADIILDVELFVKIDVFIFTTPPVGIVIFLKSSKLTPDVKPGS
jgi:hypothetical protein